MNLEIWSINLLTPVVRKLCQLGIKLISIKQPQFSTLFQNDFFRAFEERILETESAKKQAEENVEKSNMEIDSLDHNIKLIKLAIREKSNPLKVG